LTQTFRIKNSKATVLKYRSITIVCDTSIFYQVSV
jgi:hypothetical protein